MNIFSFIGLMRTIYSKKLPDLDKIERKGLLAVKIAQHFALRVDFLDESVCRHLSRLFTRAKTVEGISPKDLLLRYVDKEWFSNFEHFDDKPIAAASIGQVHRGRLTSGEEVVVKVIKDDFKDKFLNDLKRLRTLLRIALLLFPKLRKVFDPLSILDHIESYTLSELDLNNEILGKERLLKIVDRYGTHYDLSRLKLPDFHENLSNSNVLVSNFIDGFTFDSKLSDCSLNYDKLLQLFQIHGLFIFAEGEFHGDLHPGNIILDNNGYINFIDTGALSKATKRMCRGLFYFFKALTTYDYTLCAKSLNNMAIKQISGKKFDIFEDKFYKLYKDFKGKTVSEVSLTKKMMDTIKLGVNSGMEFDNGMFPIIKSLMYLDGMVLRSNPDAKLIDDMKVVITEFEQIIEMDL